MGIQETLYQGGNTVKFKAKFTDFDDVVKDPELVKFILYDYKYNKTEEFIVNSAIKDVNGWYYVMYRTPLILGGGKSYYEWYCEMGGVVSLKRSSFRTTFI